MTTRSEVESHLIQAWTCFKRDEIEDAASFADEAATELQENFDSEHGWDEEPVDCPPVPRLKFRDWWIMNPRRWFSRNVKPVTKRKKAMKKFIGVMIASMAVGVSSSYLTNPFQGPTSVARGQFSAVQQCETCSTIRLNDVNIHSVCANCGASGAVDRIAAPLTHRLFGIGPSLDDGWQFKDGSTLFITEGEYVVPELVVKTRRM